ncbi:MAG: molybdenum cofactor biosynthesis protein MoaE [Myxococcaceae bacterium]|nr:molybdenum cofactor biosynthesis protein MoaE [Myxococcaceae bacterium]
MPSLTVLYFAVARERAGTAREMLTLPPGATVADLLDALCSRHAALGPLRPHLRVAINEEFARGPEVRIPDGAEVALIPPVSGGAGADLVFRITDQPLSLDEVVRAVSSKGMGGVVTFTGVVRDETKGRRVVKLEYEAYASMAERKLAAIGAEVSARWPGAKVAIAHRVGTLQPSELAVVIAAAAPHRDAAFQACRHAIERLKQDAPIWKKEFFEDGVVWVGWGP